MPDTLRGYIEYWKCRDQGEELLRQKREYILP